MKSFLKMVSLVIVFAVSSAPLFSTADVNAAAMQMGSSHGCIEIAGGCL